MTVEPELATAVLWLDTDGDGGNVGWEEVLVEVGAPPAATVIAARFEHAVNPVRGGPYRNLALLTSRPIDREALDALAAEEWELRSALTLADDGGGALTVERPRRGRSLQLQLDPRILVATFDGPLNPHAALSLSTGAAPLPLVGGAELEIADHAIAIGAGLESGAVSGVVVGPDGGPLAGAVVELYEMVELCHAIEGCNWYPSLADRVASDEAGAFVLDAVRYRDQTVPLQHASFILRAVDPRTGHESRLTARLGGDARVRALTLAMTGRGDVVGTLRRQDGAPLADPLVVARSIATPTEGAQAVPDGSGRFRLEDLPVGAVQIVARDGAGFTSATVHIPSAGAEASVDLVLLDLGGPLAAVAGSVTDGVTAQPVPGLDVFVTPAGHAGATHVATTDGDGGFAFEGVPPGVARLRAWSPALGRYVGEAVAELVGDAVTTVEIVLAPDATGGIRGTVRLVAGGSEVPLAGAYVVARSHGVFTLTDAEGRYELAELALGRVELEVWDPVSAASTTSAVDLTADGQVLVLDFVLREDHGLGSVTVNVADREGVPVAGADVAIGRFGAAAAGRTGPDGSVRIAEVPPGRHEVLVRSGARLAQGRVEVLYPGHAAATDLVLGGLVSATIRVEAGQTGGGSSGVLTPIAYRVPGVNSSGRIGQVPEEGWTPCELESDGRCVVEGLPTNVGSLVATASSGFYGSVTAAMWIDEVPDRELVISFEAPGVIAGRVVVAAENGLQPVEGAVVELWTSTPSGNLLAQSQLTTRGDGGFRFELVTPGRFSLRTYHPDHGVGWLDARVAPGQVIDDLELVPRGRAAVEGVVSLCYAKAHAKSGQQVRIALRPANMPRPFISDLEIDDIADRFLDRTLDADDRASFAFAGLMVGGWQLSATSAVNGSAWEAISVGPAGAATVLAEPICLHPTGTVSGTVALPESGAPAPSVTVQLFRAGSPPVHLATGTTGEDGAYAFTDIPVGFEYQVRAFDAATNRGGLSRWARLCDASDPHYGGGCVRDAVLDVSLAPMGRLAGVLRDQDGLPVASAHIRLQTSVVLNQDGEVQSFQREWVSYTGPDGGFSFEGVPAGTAVVTAFDPSSPLFVERTVAVDPVAAPTTSADLELPATADVTVRVVGPAGTDLGADEPVVVLRQESSDHFREPSGAAPRVDHLAVGATASFGGVVSDRYRVGACGGDCADFGVEQILGHGFVTALGAEAGRRMSDPPVDQVVELELVGRAAVAVAVTQAGEPVEGAVVRIVGSSFYGPRDVSTQTAADGVIVPIAGLGVGRYTVTAARSGLGGSRELEITQDRHGETIELEIPIELAAAADGVVLDPSGLPSVGALVTMSFDGRSFQAVSGGDGSFAFPVLAAGHLYVLEAYAANGLGRHTLRNIVVGTEALRLGEILLDELNPWVAATAPANGDQDGDPGDDVVVDFSELMRPASLAGRIALREQGSGNPVATSWTVESQPDPDGDGPRTAFTRVRLSHAPLGSERLYLIEVSKQVEDLAGRRPAFDFHAAFRTRDVVPPQVLGVSPADDPDGLAPVGPDVVPIVTCSEPMDAASLTSETVSLLDADSRPVDAVLDLQRDGFDIRVRPLAALELDSFYTLVVDGVTDEAGLPLAAPFQATFRVRDLEPPVVALLPPLEAVVDGDAWTALEGRPLTLRTAVASNDAVRTVVLAVDGVPGAAVLDPSGEYRRSVVTPTGVAEITLSAQAEDVSGNLATPSAHVLRLVDDQPPTGVLLVAPVAEVLPNHLLAVTVDLADDHGLRTAELAVAGAVEQAWTLSLGGQAQSETRELRIPVDAAAGALITVSCEVEDSLGQRTTLAPAMLSVALDLDPPVLTRIAPAPGSSFRAGEEVSFRFALEDGVEVRSAELEIDGEQVPITVSGAALPGTSWTAEATGSWTVPEIAEAGELAWTLSAVDRAGNIGTLSGSLTVEPAQGPEDPVVRFLCPQSGDHVIPGLELAIGFGITDDDEVRHYSVAVDGAPLLEEQPVGAAEWSGEFRWTPPSEAQPGEEFLIRVVARDWNGNLGSASATLRIPTGTVLSGDQELLSSFEGQDLVLGAGEFTATAALGPRTLTLVHGATLTSPVLEPLVIEGVDELVIECSAAIDVTGKGYPGGQTYPGESLPDDWRAGGSHLGRGGRAAYWETTYGSITDPRQHGAGAGNSPGGVAGGGTALLSVGKLQFGGGGAVRANGVSGFPGGAGGSIRIRAHTVAGAGAIEARGGSSPAQLYGSGAGGAIAMDCTSLDEATLSMIRADGGHGGSNGGAGTLFLNGPDAVHGHLIVDGQGLGSDYTVPPSLGGGFAAAGSAGNNLVTDRQVGIDEYFVGHWVQISSPDGSTTKGNWRVVSVDGVVATLEADAEVAEGDRWRGMYRFDRVTVKGGANVRFFDLDDFDEVDVLPGSVLGLVNHEPPTIDPDAVSFSARSGSFWIEGGPGTVEDPDGVASAFAVNSSTGESTRLTLLDEGAFRKRTLNGSSGDVIWLKVSDNHFESLQSERIVGTLPANPSAPSIEPTLVAIVFRADSQGTWRYYVEGRDGAVSDPEDWIKVSVHNIASGGSWSKSLLSGEAFMIPFLGNPGDPIHLAVTDGHPEPLTSTYDLGPMPDLKPPVIMVEKIRISARDGRFWLSSEDPAVWDDGEITEAFVYDEYYPNEKFPLQVLADGTVALSPISDRTGIISKVVVRDGGGNEAVALLDPLPENDGPPLIDNVFMAWDADGGSPVFVSTGSCDSASDPCGFPLRSLDGISWARLENRSTPIFADVELAISEASCSSSCGIGVFGFAPAPLTAAVGDEIVLVVADGHPDSYVAEDLVAVVPQLEGAPVVDLGPWNLVLVDGRHVLRIPGGAVTDPDGPLTLEPAVWRKIGEEWTQVFTSSQASGSGEAVDLELAGGRLNDLVLLRATDATGASTLVRVGYLPDIEDVIASFTAGSVTIGETAGGVRLTVELSEPPHSTLTLRYRVEPGSAALHADFETVGDTLVFEPGMDARDILVRVIDDGIPEGSETLDVALLPGGGVALGEPSICRVTIDDQNPPPVAVTYSVGVNSGNLLDGPLGFEIENGEAVFAEPLPPGPDRGDLIVASGSEPLFIVDCVSEQVCSVADALGRPPADLASSTATAIVPAFESLADAVDSAGDAAHLGTRDLVTIGRALELVCYGGFADTGAVEIRNWVTSTDHGIRIVASATGGHRHPGSWSDTAYRLEVVGEHCVSTTVGNLQLEGLQLACANAAGADAAGVVVDGADGPVTVDECLIAVDGSDADGAAREGIAVRSGGDTELVVRNSIISDAAGLPGSALVGITADGPGLRGLLANNTIAGVGTGIAGGAEVSALNNLVVDAGTAFTGTFADGSTANLSTDGTAPGPPTDTFGEITFVNGTAGPGADFHLACGVNELEAAGRVAVSHNFDADSARFIFDGHADTLAVTNAINPGEVVLEFSEPRVMTGTWIRLSNADSHDWMVEVAMSREDLDGRTGSYREAVPRSPANFKERTWAGVRFEEPIGFQVARLVVWRTTGSWSWHNYVHLVDWWIDGLNPACGQALDLSQSDDHPFAGDVDGHARNAAWDIGADQAVAPIVGFRGGSFEWWEGEGVAKLEVLVSRPLRQGVSVRYRTVEGSADAGVDFDEVSGRLVFQPGEVSRTIVIPLTDDGVEEWEEELFVELFDAAGAQLVDGWRRLVIHDGPGPQRVRLTATRFEIAESAGSIVVPLELQRPYTEPVACWWDVGADTAFYSSDFSAPPESFPWQALVFEAGDARKTLEYLILDDAAPEDDEGFWLRPMAFQGAQPGVPSHAYVRILDDDGGSP